MAKQDKVLAALEKAYEKARQEEQEALHNDLAEVLGKHKASLPNMLLVLDLIRFELLQAKYREVIEGTVKLSDKPPIAKVKPAEKEE